MYADKMPVFEKEKFELCSDVLKALNTFAFDYISPSAFNRRFKKEVGITPIEYLIEIRINCSKIMLRRKDIPVTDIALSCGFSSSSYFATCFQNHVGISPTEYRDKYID